MRKAAVNSFEDLVARAVRQYKKAKDSDNPVVALDWFAHAVQDWNTALSCLRTTDPRADSVRQNLALTYLRMAACNLEREAIPSVDYCFRQISSLLETCGTAPAVSSKLCSLVVELAGELPVSHDARVGFLRSAARVCLPEHRTSMLPAVTRMEVHKVIRLTEHLLDDYECKQEESRQAWICADRITNRACHDLAVRPEYRHLVAARGEVGVDILNFLEDTRRINHRARTMLTLYSGMAQLRRVASEEFEMSLWLQALDELVAAQDLAQKVRDEPPVLGQLLGPAELFDVEVVCVCGFQLAQAYSTLGMPAQAKKQYMEVVRVGISLDGSGKTMYASAIDDQQFYGPLQGKPWFRVACQWLRKAQKDSAAKTEEARAAARASIFKDVAAMQQANTSSVALVSFLVKEYDPKFSCEHDRESKQYFLQVVRAFSADKQSGRKNLPVSRQTGVAFTSEHWTLFCQEASKCLNHWYEAEHKQP